MCSEKIAEHEYNSLEYMLKNESLSIIIWGLSRICRQLLQMYDNFTLHQLTIWDRSLYGSNVFGHEVLSPDIEIVSNEFKNSGYIFLAFTSEKNYLQCEKLLRDEGFKNIINCKAFCDYVLNKLVMCQYNEYILKNKDENFMINPDNTMLITTDIFDNAGENFNDPYLIQDLWAAKKIFKERPSIHYDIGSCVKGFISHLLSFDTSIVMIDIRPLDTFGVENLTFIKSNATNLSGIDDSSIESMSALCSLEHFGLGRYGDPLDPEAHIKAFNSIQRVLKKGADLYISVPVSAFPLLVFNAHRVYSPELIVQYFNRMDLVEFSHTSINGLVKNASLDCFADHKHYCYGLFHFKKS